MLNGTQLDIARQTLGVDIVPGTARAYPDLAALVSSIIGDKVMGLPWLPPGWATAVAGLQKNNPDDLVLLYPANGSHGQANSDAPQWMDAAQRKAWTGIALGINAAVGKYAAADAAAGAAGLQALYADAAFWDGAYRAADYVAKLPGKIGDAVTGSMSSTVKLVIAGVGLVLLAFIGIALARGVKSVKG